MAEPQPQVAERTHASDPLEDIIRSIRIVSVEKMGAETYIIKYMACPRCGVDELELVARNFDPRKLTHETIAKIILLAGLMSELAGDIEFENYPVEHGYIHPDGWTAKRYTDEMGTNALVIEHQVYESNA